MAYFRFLPDIQYISPFESRQSNDEYVLAKNLFKRIKISDDGSGAAFLFNKYVIEEGERPDTVSAKVYGNSNYDWLVIVAAGIINQRDEWPLSSQELYEFSLNKYGNDLTAIKHYRTTEVKDSNGRLILPAGQVVDQNFTISNPDNPLSTLNPVEGLTNYEYEYELNNEKRTINMIKPEYRLQIVTELANLFQYQPDTSQYVDAFLKKVDNIRKKSP
jgi:hypothetical protein